MMTPSPRLLPLAIAAAAMIATGSDRAVAQGGPLQPGQRIEGRLIKDAPHTYTVSLSAGQSAEIVIEQPLGNVLETIHGSDGLVLSALGSADVQMRGRPDRLVLATTVPADFAIELTERDGYGGDYAITVTQIGEATAADFSRFEAQRMYSEAMTGTTAREWTPARRALLEASLAISRRVGDDTGQLNALLSLGLSYQFADRRLAMAHFLAALDVARRAGDLRSEAEALNDLGETSTAIGEPRQAAEYYLRALDVGARIDPATRDDLLTYNLSVAYREAGEYEHALRYGHEVLARWSVIDTPDAEAYAARNVGLTHFLLGDSDAALRYLAVAYERWLPIKRFNGAATAMTAIGTVRAARGDHQQALDDFRKAAALFATMGVQAEVGPQGLTASRLAASLAAVGRWPEAGAQYDDALRLARRSGSTTLEADALRGLGDVRRQAGGAAGDPLELYQQALALERAAEDRAGEAATLLAMARLARERQDWSGARAHIERAVELIESLRTTVSSPDLRASFAATKRDYYDFYIDLLMQLHRREPAAGHAVAALLVSERGRARSLLEMITESAADIRAGAPATVLERERALQREVTTKAARLTRVLGAAHTAAQAEAARAELQATVNAYDDAQARVRAESPRYAALAHPAPLDLATLRDRVLDDQTALVEYALGRERSYVWIVTRQRVIAHQLPGREVVEDAAREAYDRLAASDRRETWGQAARAARRLSDVVLAPVIGDLTQPRLLIVADGALHYVPFAALPRPASNGTPMVADFEIVNLPSASALAVIRSETAGRVPAPNRVAVLADPVLEPSDARVGAARAATGAPAAGSDLLRSATESGITHFTRLAFTRDEADAIAAVSGPSRSMFSVDFEASRATALGPQLANYRVVHFATHGLINSAHPQLSGLVLSLVDPRGAPQDGFVRLHDIYNMKLGADLVVLSACRTALGRDIRGDGLIGLTRGFMFAGAPRVVASLWDVRDRATAELMKRFYARMLGDGMSPAAALRAAQVSMWKDPRWQSPFNWAGFVIQGEWTKLP